MNKSEYIKGVERLVNPIDVGTLHFMQSFNNWIPKKLQRKMVKASGEKTPLMGFVVEPYSYFLCYEIKDFQQAKTFLPEGFELMKTKVFKDDEPAYYGIFGCFNAHTSGFWGMRLEFYLIAKNLKTGLLTWVIVDYDTNTITYDPKNVLGDANAKRSLLTVDYSGTLYLDSRSDQGRHLIFESDLTQGLMKDLDQRLWIEGNLSIAYGKLKADDHPDVFSLKFDPLEFQEALKLPKNSIKIIENNWFPGLLKEQPKEILCFPYAQHYLSDSPGHYSHLKDEKGLVKAIETVDFSQVDVFSTKPFKKSILMGASVSFFINMTFFILYLLK